MIVTIIMIIMMILICIYIQLKTIYIYVYIHLYIYIECMYPEASCANERVLSLCWFQNGFLQKQMENQKQQTNSITSFAEAIGTAFWGCLIFSFFSKLRRFRTHESKRRPHQARPAAPPSPVRHRKLRP